MVLRDPPDKTERVALVTGAAVRIGRATAPVRVEPCVRTPYWAWPQRQSSRSRAAFSGSPRCAAVARALRSDRGRFEEHNNMVLVRDIELYSLCEHHMLPFYGRCHVGYIPKGRVFGISKIARLVDMYARRLQIQERLTDEIAQTIMSTIDPYGVGVVIEAHHLCMMMRGVQKQNSMLMTSTVLGTFRTSHPTRAEFLSLLDRPKP